MPRPAPVSSSCGVNWLCVSETIPDGDTTYVRTSVIGATDLYAPANLSSIVPLGSTIQSVQISLIARKSSSTTGATIAALLKSGSSIVGGSPFALSASYQTYNQTWMVSPFTGLAWTLNELSSLQAGEQYLSGTAPARVTNILISVVYTPP